jgi:DNA processing protein
MIEPLTTNTQAILLLTAPLLAGSGAIPCDLLSLSEYNRLARILREKQKQPADLIGPEGHDVIEFCAPVFGRARLEALLGRGFLLSQAVNHWNARAIWVISRADSAYPKRFKTRLKENAPPVLYGCGNLALLDKGGLAVVGSRHVDEESIAFTEKVGRLAADAHQTIVSGGAKGIDQAAMHGALSAGGEAIGVLADSLERAVLARDYLEPLRSGRLLLFSPYDPAAGFNVGHAMQRNKLIYALADAGFVVTSDLEKGGTWAGAVEQLEKLRFVPVFVRNGANTGRGNPALLQRGAKPWPNPQDGNDLSLALITAANVIPAEPKQESFALQLGEEPAGYGLSKPDSSAVILAPQSKPAESQITPSAKLLEAVCEILAAELAKPATDAEVAEMLAVSKAQAKEWLNRLVQCGVLEKSSKPTRYRTAKTTDKLL